MKHYVNKHVLMNGAIVLYQQATSKTGVWQMRLKFPTDMKKGYVVRTTGRYNFAEASAYAQTKYQEIWNDLTHGVEIMTNTSFTHMFEEYMLFNMANVGLHLSQHSITNFRYFGRYWCEYFSHRDVRKLQTRDFDDYYAWRRTYWTSGPGKHGRHKRANVVEVPSDTTLRQDRQRLNQFLEYLLNKRVIRYKPKINVMRRDTSSRRKVGNRDHFTEDEWHKARKEFDRWANGPEAIKLGPYHHYSRLMAFNFIMVSANTGTRPGETIKIRWRDIGGWSYAEGVSGQITINIPPSRKTGAYVAIGQFTLQKYLKNLWRLHKDTFGKRPSQDDYIFKSYRQGQYALPQKTFKKILTGINMYTDVEGRTRTLYSLRGYYISLLLARGETIHQVAKVCGTSVQQIERHYDRTAPTITSSSLRPK